MGEKFARSCQNGHPGGIGQLLQLRAKNGAGDEKMVRMIGRELQELVYRQARS
jgi:hypothetical protein